MRAGSGGQVLRKGRMHREERGRGEERGERRGGEKGEERSKRIPILRRQRQADLCESEARMQSTQ